MTIDEAIEKLLNKAEEQEYVSQIIVELHREESEREHKDACDACATEYRQLAAWLTKLKELEAKHWDECRQIAHYDGELKEAKRLLKVAVEDLEELHSEADCSCNCCKGEKAESCQFIKCWTWRYADEALKLIES